MGRTSAYPPKKRLSDDIGGIYGPGASGPGNPALMSPNAQSATGSAALSPQDIIQYFELNADKGSVEHAYRLGALYYGGEYYVGRNYKKAFLYFQVRKWRAMDCCKSTAFPQANWFFYQI